MDDFLDDNFDDGFSDGQEEGYALFGAFTDNSYGGEPENKSTLHCCCGAFVILVFLMVFSMVLGAICS